MSEKPNSLFNRLWDKYNKAAKIVAMLAFIVTAVEGVVLGVRFWDDWTALKQLFESEKKVNERLDAIEAFIFEKKSSYAVGFRVEKVFDQETGGVIKVQQYRDWLGRSHNVYLDLESTELFGIDHYYYINPKSHEKIYCW